MQISVVLGFELSWRFKKTFIVRIFIPFIIFDTFITTVESKANKSISSHRTSTNTMGSLEWNSFYSNVSFLWKFLVAPRELGIIPEQSSFWSLWANKLGRTKLEINFLCHWYRSTYDDCHNAPSHSNGHITCSWRQKYSKENQRCLKKVV